MGIELVLPQSHIPAVQIFGDCGTAGAKINVTQLWLGILKFSHGFTDRNGGCKMADVDGPVHIHVAAH